MRSNNFYISTISVVAALAVVALTAYGINNEREGTEYKRENSVKNEESVKEIREQLAKTDTEKTDQQNATDDKSQQVIAADPSGKNDSKAEGDEPASVTDTDKKSGEDKTDVKTSADPDPTQKDKNDQTKEDGKNTDDGQTQKTEQTVSNNLTDGKQTKNDDKSGNTDTTGKTGKTNESDKSGKTGKAEPASAPALNFKEEDGLSWPVSGNVIMTFSTESVVYYETLGQFRASDKILIGADEAEPVLAAADGIVTKVESDRERGNSVTVDIGNGFEVVYGELEDIKVNQGDKVKRGQAFAKVSSASGYYEKEGTNLYFMVKENGEAVNPMYLLD